MELKKGNITLGLLAAGLLSASVYANTGPHFYVKMENRSAKPASISFQPDVGSVSLNPIMSDHTPLAAQETSEKYEVYFKPLDTKSTFNIVFTGKQDCTFNIGYYGPANPKVTVSGPGCYGGGYQITDSGHTLLLYVSDIHLK